MALNFPNTPSNGQIFTDSTTGVKFIYYSSPGVWKRLTGSGSSISVGATAPASPSNGDLWYYTVDGQIYVYYNDGDSSQWVTAVGGGQLNNANNALTANNSSYLGGLAAVNYVNTSYLTSALASYASLGGGTFTGNVTFNANTTHVGPAIFNNYILTTSNVTISNTLSVSGNVTFNNTLGVSGNVTITGVGSSILIGNSSANSFITSSSIVLSSSSSVTSITPGSLSSTNTTLGGTTSISSILEAATLNSTAISGVQNIDILTTPTIYYTTSAAANWSVNVRGNSNTTLNSIISNGQSVSISLIVTQGNPAFYPTAFSIDGTSVTVKWLFGSIPSSGDINSIDVYTYTIVKINPTTFTVLGGFNKYA